CPGLVATAQDDGRGAGRPSAGRRDHSRDLSRNGDLLLAGAVTDPAKPGRQRGATMLDGRSSPGLGSGVGRALLRILTALVLVVCASAPAFAQQNDVKASQFLDATYQVDPAWRLNFYAEIREDHNVNRWDNSIFRPNVQYGFAPHWRVAVGYVQFQQWH